MSVTTDVDVLKGWPKTKKTSVSSAEIATALGLTVFQITARLKGMQDRELLARTPEGKWFITPQGISERENPSPSISGRTKSMRALDSRGVASGAPIDSEVPRTRINKDEWMPPIENVEECRRRLPDIERQLKEYRKDKTRTREAMALQTELDHCLRIINIKRGKHKWTARTEHTSTGAERIMVAPDGREYVVAASHEVADLLIEYGASTMRPIRLRLFSTSNLARTLKRSKQREEADRQRQEARNQRVLAEEEPQPSEGKRPSPDRTAAAGTTAGADVPTVTGVFTRGSKPGHAPSGRPKENGSHRHAGADRDRKRAAKVQHAAHRNRSGKPRR